MAAGDLLLDASGNRIVTTDGDERLSDGAGDDCCCCPCATLLAACTACGDCTPASIGIVLSSVTGGHCAQYGGGGPARWYKITGTPDGMHCLTHMGGCDWEGSISQSWTVAFFDDAGCMTPSATTGGVSNVLAVMTDTIAQIYGDISNSSDGLSPHYEILGTFNFGEAFACGNGTLTGTSGGTAFSGGSGTYSRCCV